MKKVILFSALILLSLIVPLVESQETKQIDLYFFYGQGCPHCAKAEAFLENVEINYPNLVIHKHETYFNEGSRNLFLEMSNEYGKQIEGVPTIFLDNKVFVGFSNSIGEQIEEKLAECEERCETEEKNEENSEDFTQAITVPAVISAAIVDAINPCAFAVLIILLTTILASKDRKRALLAGLAFSASIFISYFLMGIGLYTAINASGLTHTFYIVVAILAIILGLFNLKDYFWYGRWFITEVPQKWRPRLKSLLGRVTSVPGAFLIGFVISLFLLPCTSGPYIVILGLLSQVATKNSALMLLILYNLIFILPMIIITLAIYFGITTTEKAENLRQKKLKILHLIAGIIILCLGVGMLLAIKLGFI
jgi:cytochrome c biogenesis protein CcdA/glutaredoxin